MAELNGQGQRYSLSNNSYITYRSSGVIAHRLSIYMQSIFPNVKNTPKLILELNSQVTLYREMLIQMGQVRDNPELRKEIRRTRQLVLETCHQAVESLGLEQRSCNTSHSKYVIPLVCLLQLFSKELAKSYRLIQIIPLDMSRHNENRNRPTNFGNVIGQILLCKEITPDFNHEELCSIENDVRDIGKLLNDLKFYSPDVGDTASIDDDDCTSIRFQNKTRSLLQRNDSKQCRSSGLLCCIKKH